MPHKKIYAIGLMLWLAAPIGDAQAQMISDPMTNKPYYSSSGDQSGNPFITPSWDAGTILGENGVRYKGIQVNYDVIQKKVVFKIKDDAIYIFNDPVKEFTIDDASGGGSRRFVRSDNIHPELPATFVEVLVSGKVGFFKHITKSIREVTEYNSMPRKVIEEKIQYYILQEGTLQRASLTKKSLQEIFPNRGADLDAFIRQQGLSPKNETDWIRIIEHLNQSN